MDPPSDRNAHAFARERNRCRWPNVSGCQRAARFRQPDAPPAIISQAHPDNATGDTQPWRMKAREFCRVEAAHSCMRSVSCETLRETLARHCHLSNMTIADRNAQEGSSRKGVSAERYLDFVLS